MNRHARLLLQFFLPPLLASLPIAISTAIGANQGGGYDSTTMFFVSCGVGFAIAVIPSFIAVLVFSAAVAFGIDPHNRALIAAWAFSGVLSGILVSNAITPDLAVGHLAPAYALAWGGVGIVIVVLERWALKNRANHSTEPLSPGLGGSS